MNRPVILVGSSLLSLLALAIYLLLGLRGADRWVKHTDDVRLALTHLEGAVVDAEAGQRGYIATLDPRFREPYDRARAEWPTLLAMVRTLTVDNTDQQRRLDALEPVLRDKFTEMQNTLEARERGIAGDELVSRMFGGTQLMQDIRRRTDELLSNEEKLDHARQAEAVRQSRTLVGLLVLTAVLFAAAAAWFYARRRLELIERARVDERMRAAEALLSAQRLFTELLENLPELAWTALPDGHVDVFNRRWFEYTGTTHDEVRGWGWEKLVDVKALAVVTERWRHSLATGEPFEMEFPLRGADGRFRWFLTRVRTLRDATGAIVRWVGVNTDVHDLRTEKEYQERFVAVLGHDLRNPLGAIDMAAGVLRQRADKTKDEGVRRVLDRIASSSRRMSRMIEQLLDLTRSRLGGGLEVKPEPVDLGAPLKNIVDELRTAHPASTIVFDPSPPIVGAWDRDRLEQVFSNLVGNALHHGTKDAPVTVDCRTVGDEAVVRIHNEGPAIPQDVRTRLFDPFRRGARESRTKHTAGLGLGLFISAQIIKAHGGRIEVDSSAERGTTFTVILPRSG